MIKTPSQTQYDAKWILISENTGSLLPWGYSKKLTHVNKS